MRKRHATEKMRERRKVSAVTGRYTEFGSLFFSNNCKTTKQLSRNSEPLAALPNLSKVTVGGGGDGGGDGSRLRQRENEKRKPAPTD